MTQLFKVGEYYRNREGEYQIIDLHGDQMTIRYVSGKTINTSISTQQRILGNIEIEQEIEDEKNQAASGGSGGAATQHTSASFTGFTEADFGSLGGSTWRSRSTLGGVLSDYLRKQTSVPFQSWGVRRRLEMHLARPDKYNFDAPFPCVKLFVYTHENLDFGYYIETPPRVGMKDSPEKYQDWISFRDELRERNTMQSVLLEPMLNHRLVMTDLYYRDHTSPNFGGALRCEFQFMEGSLKWYRRDFPQWKTVDAQGMFDRVSKLPEDTWVDLHIFRSISKKEAIAAGSEIVRPILEVLRSLVPLYQITVER